MMKNKVGPPVTGSDFFDREVEQSNLWRYLEEHSVLLLAPRRVGKTSLMRKLVDDAQTRDLHAFYITVEGAQDEAEFVRRLYQGVADLNNGTTEKVFEAVSNSVPGEMIKRTKKIGGMGFSIELGDRASEQWPELAQTLGKALAKANGRWLIAIDELPVFILQLIKNEPTTESAALFLHRLRELRQNLDHTRWLLAGSIGLDTVVGRHNLGDTINDLVPTPLGPFATGTAAEFLLELTKSHDITLSPQTRGYIVERLAWPIPYYLQLIFQHLLDTEIEAPDREDIDHLFEALLTPANKVHFDYWKQRLHEELGTPDDKHATLLLSAISRDPSGAALDTLRQHLGQRINDPDERDERLRYLLDILENDGYLVREDERYRFRMPLLREYWLRRIAQ